MSSCLGVASKVLLMSIAMSSVILCGALWLKPSSMSCVICVSNVLVEFFGLKLCWVGDSGMCGEISRSITLKAVLSSVCRVSMCLLFCNASSCNLLDQ